MSVVNRNFKVEYIVSAILLIDITEFVVSLDDFVLQSTGKISTAKFTLNAEFGSFISNDGGGATPKIKQFDRIRISIIGDDGLTTQMKIFEVTTDLAQLAGRSSHYLPLELEGRERNLAGIPFGAFIRSATHATIIREIEAAYNSQRGSLQPVLATLFEFPDFNPNIWDFTQVDNCWDALLEVINSLDLPVSAGGAGNRYALIFNDLNPISTGLDFLTYDIPIQGTKNPGSIPILQQNLEHPITTVDKIKQPPTGSLVVARGRPKTGTLSTNISLFFSELEFYRAIKLWDNTIAYPTDSVVALGQNVGGWSQKWIANIDTNPGNEPGINPSWTSITVGDFIDASKFIPTDPNVLQYSSFTQDKVQPIINGFANPIGGFNPNVLGAISIPDHNLVINDVRGTGDAKIGTFRNFVTFRTNTVNQLNLIADQRKYLLDIDGAGGQGFGFYDGFTVLVDPNVGALEAPFDGNDSNGVPFANNFAMFVAKPNSAIFNAIPGNFAAAGEWIVTRITEDFDQCAVYDEAINYEFNVPFSNVQGQVVYPGQDRRRGGSPASTDFEWRSIANIFMGNDCFHTPVAVTQTDGLVADFLVNNEPLKDSLGDFYNKDSGIKIEYGYNQVDETPDEEDVWSAFFGNLFTGGQDGTQFIRNLLTSVYTHLTTPNYTNMGWWYAWRTPYPFSTFGGITEQIGQLYGGDGSSLNNHRYFDVFNIQYTTTGKRGWTHDDSPDLSEITGAQFLFTFDITIAGFRVPFKGDLPFAYWCIDSNGTVWKSEKKMYRHLGETQEIKIEFGDLSPVFRGRTPLGVDNILENILVADIEINEEFFKDRIVIQGFQWEAPYDDFGRYAPNLFEQVISAFVFNPFGGGLEDIRFTGIIDAFGFTKTPVAISKPTVFSGERTIIPNFEDHQNIVNVEQLQRFSDSQVQLESFPYEQFSVVQGGINDLELEESVFLFDPFLIDEEDKSGTPNTRLLTLREIHYAVPKDRGLVRTAVFTKVIDV